LERLSDASFLGKLLVLPPNDRLDLAPGFKVMKLFSPPVMVEPK
jgi:hypothetical protein